MNNLILVLCVSFTIQSCFAYSEEEEWKNFKSNFSKKYESLEDEQQRKETFLENLKEINEHNERFKNGSETYETGINQFTDLTQQEFVSRMTIQLPKDPKLLQIQTKNISLRGPLPNNVNWVKRGFNTFVGDQGNCGCCYAFAATGAIEAQLFLKHNMYVKISEQDALDCSMFYGNSGCRYGWMSNVFEYAKTEGIALDRDVPYQEEETQCVRNYNVYYFKIKNYFYLKPNDEEVLKKAVATIGPITVAFDATRFYSYRGGVFFDPQCQTYNNLHAVLLVGYGTTPQGQDYWLIKNSWGGLWGERGYAKIARNKNNHCGIAAHAVYPVIY